MKIKKGDKVVILQGKDRGKSGEVLKAFPRENKVLVKGLNIKTVHKKPVSKGEKGEIVKNEFPVDVSNVAVVDPKTKKPTRIRFEIKNNKKVRVTQKSNSVLK